MARRQRRSSARAGSLVQRHDAKIGAFVASAVCSGILDLAEQGLREGFNGARDAMVSYPLLASEKGAAQRIAVS
jgi:hypothetical protein